jgi:hypothetical protein
VLVDTSTILRTLQPLHPQREVARSAIKALTAQGVEVQIVAQNLIESWVVATRPIEQNGLGMTAVAAEELGRILALSRLRSCTARRSDGLTMHSNSIPS